MTSLFPLIDDKDLLYAEMASQIFHSILRTKQEYIMFKKDVTEIFKADVYY